MAVGVRDPRRTRSEVLRQLAIEDHAFSTAGDYERCFVVGGKRYHHIIDPRTGYPATACRSVTIWANDAFIADAIDDAVFILGPEKGLALVESIDGCRRGHRRREEQRLGEQAASAASSRSSRAPSEGTLGRVFADLAQRERRRAASSRSRAQRTSRTRVHFGA